MISPSAQNGRAPSGVWLVSVAASSSSTSPTVRARPTSSDRRALIKAKAEERAAAKAERAALGAKLAQAADAADAADRSACVAVLDRIQRRAADDRARRKPATALERRRASLLRKNPHIERDAAIKLGRRLVTDPTTLGEFIEVQVNRQLDVLTMEHSARPQRISDVEFAIGRLLQDAWGGRKDGDRRMESIARLGVVVSSGGDDGPLPSREMGMLRETFRARAVAQLDLKIEHIVGRVGLRLLRAILVEGHTFGTYAACTVGGGERGAARIGERFRWLLNEVAEHLHTATGADGQHIRATRNTVLP
ncbi:hypothetical protein LNAOJCKE_3006 [Methylorubrum aminovorans]|uniref:Uncharacterized protein n=1 Tax=Methylorubrum aminovorans TaxID=269069 RepID=A0ABQ4UFL7_9HYPH|nr:hypothetical protein LNAOJCKE_3006 [Methylorubrum aminovorans]GMA75852.1 hypothetical protein GCM10025880_22690 [Methylorubrum aminovorans]